VSTNGWTDYAGTIPNHEFMSYRKLTIKNQGGPGGGKIIVWFFDNGKLCNHYEWKNNPVV